MARAMLHIALGPVQDFIAAARRTRDLWFGSHMLSEVSKAAARAMRDHEGAELIFPVPALENGRDVLEAAYGMFQRDPTGGLLPTVPSPNKLWSVVSAPTIAQLEAVVAEVAQQATAAAQNQWRCFAARVHRPRAGSRIVPVANEREQPERRGDSHALVGRDRIDLWEEQIERLLEVFAAWRPLSDDTDDAFRQARIELISAVEEAKTLRAFSQWSPPAAAPRQSSLDAARYDVLADNAHEQRGGRRYRIAKNEALSAVDLVKRAGGEPEQFVPVTNIALAPWHAHAKAKSRPEWDIVNDAMRAFAKASGKDVFGFDRTGQVPRRTLNAGHWTMHYDAQVFLENRARKTLEEAIGPYNDKTAKRKPEGCAALDVETAVTKLLARVGALPIPYVACLMGDGDGLGNVLMELGQADSKRVSQALCAFSVRASGIVDHHLGLPIYAGGDDVLALVPLQNAAQCAADLTAAYHAIVGNELENHDASFSVGIGIGHVLDPLSDLLELGREAERVAKGNDLPKSQQRRAVAVILEKRGGQRRTWRSRWPLDERPDPPARIAAAIGRIVDDRLSTKKLFELDDLLRRMHVEKPATLAPEDAQSLSATLVTMTARILARSEGRGGRAARSETSLTPEAVGLDLEGALDYTTVRDRLKDWVELHVIARLLADATYAAPKPWAESEGAAS